MGTTRRLGLILGSLAAALAIFAGTLLSGAEDVATDRALVPGNGAAGPKATPSTAPTVAPVPAEEPAPPQPAHQPDGADEPNAPAAPTPDDADPAAPPAEVPIPRDPVPLPDRAGPAITNVRFVGCVVAADVTDPSGVAAVTLSWDGVPDPQLPGQWLREPGSVRMQLLQGTQYQAGRGHSYRGMVFTVTAVDRTLVGSRSSQSITFDWNLDPC